MPNIYNHWTMTFSGTQSFGVWFYYWNDAGCSSYSGFRDAAVGTHTSPYVLDLGGWPEGAYPAFSVEQRTDAPSTTLTIHHKIEVGPSPTGPWSLCAEFDLTSVQGAATQWSACYPYHAAPSGPCVPRIKAGMPAIEVLDNAILAAALALLPGNWWGALLGWYLGMTTDVHVLCATLPPTISTITTDMLINPVHGALDVLHATLWPYYCECTPATPSPAPPPLPNPVKPPDWPPDKVFPVNPTNPCLDITDVRRMLTQLLQLVQRDLETDTLEQRWSLPFATTPGTVHAGLTGSGSFAVSRILGVLISWTGGQPADVWEGNPPYFKDLGWCSASDGGAMLMETRITRQQQLWLPRSMQLATSIGYYAKPGITLAIEEIGVES